MGGAERSELAALVRWIYEKGWSPGTGGNYSQLLSRDPFRLLITPSGSDKGALAPGDLLVVDENAKIVGGGGQPSAESLLHVAILEAFAEANVVVHTHSISNTLASLEPGDVYEISGLEMLKGLKGVKTHEHVERVPILDNSQDIPALVSNLKPILAADPAVHGFLLRGHGLYTWGHNGFEARRHLEIFEFLFELTVAQRR